MEIKYPVYKPHLIGNERKYVNECIDSTWISSKGKFISLFEKSFSKFLGVSFATTCSNGTTALHLALLALDIGKGDEVILPTLTYVASANSILYVGAKPVFVDSEINTWNIDVDQIERKITKKTKAIMAVHLYGHPSNMARINEIAKKHNLFVIEDCAEAIGSKIGDKYVGTFGDISIFSFFGNKTITTGEGGMVVTKNEELIEKVRLLKNQGVSKVKEYWHEVLGYNYRMTNISAAIGYAQMEKIDMILYKKKQIAKWYQEAFNTMPVIFHQEQIGYTHSYWMCSVLFENEKLKNKIRKILFEKGIETRPIFNPVHLMPVYNVNENYGVSENLNSKGINLPSFPGLEKEEIVFIVKIITDNL